MMNLLKQYNYHTTEIKTSDKFYKRTSPRLRKLHKYTSCKVRCHPAILPSFSVAQSWDVTARGTTGGSESGEEHELKNWLRGTCSRTLVKQKQIYLFLCSCIWFLEKLNYGRARIYIRIGSIFRFRTDNLFCSSGIRKTAFSSFSFIREWIMMQFTCA